MYLRLHFENAIINKEYVVINNNNAVIGWLGLLQGMLLLKTKMFSHIIFNLQYLAYRLDVCKRIYKH